MTKCVFYSQTCTERGKYGILFEAEKKRRRMRVQCRSRNVLRGSAETNEIGGKCYVGI